MGIDDDVFQLAVNVRHRLHRIPELGYHEFKTAAVIREQLDQLGIAYVAGLPEAPTATVAMIGKTTSPCLALRADIDALPILERTGLPYASEHPGTMHACGHDGHSATLLGTAAALKVRENDLPVGVKLMWQPAEEGGGGALKLVNAGVFDGRVGPMVNAVFGLHGWPGMPVGTVGTKSGPLLAATDNFSARFIGRGCHGGYPQLGIDPIVAAAEAVINLQQVVAREIDPTDSAVVTVGKIRGGSATNIIPDDATIEGTARTLNPESRKLVQRAIARRIEHVAAAGGCAAEFTWLEGYPPTVNDPAMSDYVRSVCERELGVERFVPIGRASMGGEDFAYYLEKIPGCFFLVGVQPDRNRPYPSLHSDRYDFTDEALKVGIGMFLGLVNHWGK